MDISPLLIVIVLFNAKSYSAKLFIYLHLLLQAVLTRPFFALFCKLLDIHWLTVFVFLAASNVVPNKVKSYFLSRWLLS